MLTSALKFFCRIDARHRFAIALVAALALFAGLRGEVQFSSNIIATWDLFAFVALVLVWITILTTPQHRLRERARAQDIGRTAIFVFVVLAACAALFAVGFLISFHKDTMRGHFTAHLILALSSVILSWSLAHTVFGLRYAHAFYGDSDEPGQDRHAGGLLFPGDRPPDYFDFVYFSFVVGMTCQVSDVQITSRRMRRLTLTHSVLAFGFNTIILALLINTVSGLI
jgi:uncharacterized membrane protein